MPPKEQTSQVAKVLIVDDETNMRRTLTDILLDEGYEVASAATGEEAIELCASNEYDVILMDVRMPGIDGVEAFRKIRRHREGVRVILMSAYGLDDLKHAALDEGAVAFLAKPLDLEKTVNLISEVKNTAILVIAEDDEIAGPLQNALKDQGYRVTVTKSPNDAL